MFNLILSLIYIQLTIGVIKPAYGLIIDKNKMKVELESLDDYDKCHSLDYSGDICHQAMLDWVKQHPGDAFKAGKKTRSRMNAWGAIGFFNQSLKKSDKNCGDEDVKLSVLSALDLPESQSNQIKMAKEIVFNKCSDKLVDEVVSTLSSSGYMFKNVCKDLLKLGKLKGVKAKKCSKM